MTANTRRVIFFETHDGQYKNSHLTEASDIFPWHGKVVFVTDVKGLNTNFVSISFVSETTVKIKTAVRYYLLAISLSFRAAIKSHG